MITNTQDLLEIIEARSIIHRNNILIEIYDKPEFDFLDEKIKAMKDENMRMQEIINKKA